MFFREVTYIDQGWIYLFRNTVKQKNRFFDEQKVQMNRID